MENSSYVLVLTGAVLPGYTAESVWPALAAYFRMEPDKLQQQLLVRAPLTIKQSDDLGKLQTLQAGAAAVGAEAEICAPDGRPALFVLLDNAPRGPVPRVFVEERVEHGLWADSLSVAEVGSSTWQPFRQLMAPAAVAPPSLPPATDLFSTTHAASASVAVTALPSQRYETGTEGAGDLYALPAGEAIHAGFWRRCAAMVIDGILISIASAVVQAIVGVGMMGAAGAGGDIRPGAIVGAMMMPILILFVGQWLYFALFESGKAQATPGKMAMGIKVVDDVGQRIGFGRASGRYFGKIVSGLILNIGYLLAGWTARKQALHDMMASTLVVFNGVQPGQPMPAVRPPMPWYGWLLNVLLFGGIALAIVGFFVFAASLASLGANAQGGSGF
ncbi:MAG TPA: RDD family protein [Dokdonella sp.]